MESTFRVFRTFMDRFQADDLARFLSENGIQTELGDNLPPYDLHFSGSEHANRFEVKLQVEDFEQATQLLKAWASGQRSQLPADYYMFHFSDAELYQVLLQPDKWSDLDVHLAETLLEERGKPVDKAQVEAMSALRNQDLAQPEPNQFNWIVLGYILLFVSAGAISSVIGYTIWKNKKTLPNGETVYAYREKDRQRGKILFMLSILVVCLLIALQFLSYVNLY